MSLLGKLIGEETAEEIERERESKETIKNEKKDVKKRYSLNGWTILGVIIGISLGKFLGAAVFVLIVPFLIGLFFPKLYLKKWKVSQSAIKIIAWANVIAWLLPPIGMLISGLTLGFSKSAAQQEQRKHTTLAIVGLTLSVINSVLGVVYL